MAVQSSRFYSDNKGSQKSFYKKYCLWRGSWHYILQLCISAEAVSEMYPHLVRTCFFCIDKCVLQREWWIQTLPQSLWTMELSEPKPNKTRFWVIQAWKVMLHFVLVYFPELAKNILYNYTAKKYDQYYLCHLPKKYSWNN